MVRTKLQKCTECGEFGLDATCKKCDAETTTAAPLKFSPKDPQGARRRQRVNAGSDEWIEALPSPRKVFEDEEE